MTSLTGQSVRDIVNHFKESSNQENKGLRLSEEFKGDDLTYFIHQKILARCEFFSNINI